MATGVHQSRRAAETSGVIPVNPILESISSSISALPLAVASGAQASNPRGGGFAATLAAAQGLPAPSLRPSHDGSGDSANPFRESPAGSAGQTRQAKKSSNGTTPMSRNLVPASAPLAASAPSPDVTANPATFGTIQNPGLLAGSVSGIAEAVLQSSAQSAQGGGAVQSSSRLSTSAGIALPITASTLTDGQASSIQYSGLVAGSVGGVAEGVLQSFAQSVQGGGSAQSSSRLSTSAGIALPTTASTLTDGKATSVVGNGQSSLFTTVERQAATVPTPNAASGPQQESFETQPAPTLMASNIQPSLSSFATGQPSSAYGQPSPGANSTNATPAISAEPVLETAQAIAAATPGPMSSATGLFAFEAAASSQSAASNSADGTEGSAVATDPAAQPIVGSQAGDQLAAIVNASTAVAPVVGASTASLPLRAAAARPVGSKAGAEGATANHGAAASASSASSSGSSSVGQPSAASLTPFAVFFSDPGSGAEGAVAALPKMILPAAAHAGSAIPSVAASGNTPGSSHNNIAPNVAPQGKGTSSGSQSGNSLTATPTRKDADANATNATTDPAPLSVAPVPAASSTSPVAGILQSSLPTTPGDGLPKADPTPAGAGNSGTPVPVTPQAMPIALPGPVQMAQMVSRAGQAEMRIGMTTSAFGSVEVRTVVHANDVGVIIGSEKGDLRSLLANEIPAITNSLQQQSLRLNSVNFMQGFAFSNNSSGGESQQHSFNPPPSAANPGSANPASSEAPQEDSLEAALAAYRGGASNFSILA
jgi:hypothetical protein